LFLVATIEQSQAFPEGFTAELWFRIKIVDESFLTETDDWSFSFFHFHSGAKDDKGTNKDLTFLFRFSLMSGVEARLKNLRSTTPTRWLRGISSVSFTQSRWYHAAVSYGTDLGRLFSSMQQTHPTPLSLGPYLDLGFTQVHKVDYFAVETTDMRFWSVARSADQIRALWNGMEPSHHSHYAASLMGLWVNVSNNGLIKNLANEDFNFVVVNSSNANHVDFSPMQPPLTTSSPPVQMHPLKLLEHL
jgi:hypothetical protein